MAINNRLMFNVPEGTPLWKITIEPYLAGFSWRYGLFIPADVEGNRDVYPTQEAAQADAETQIPAVYAIREPDND